MTLDELARKYDTDKGSNGHFYTRHYEKIFGDITHTVESLCEVGIGSGASLRMWQDYFPNARIYGVDQNKMDDMGGKITCYDIEQTDAQKLKDYLGDKHLDIIVEDASHEQEKTFKTLDALWPLLRSRGWYVIEDMAIDRFPPEIGAWYGQHPEIDKLYILRNQNKSCLITFIQKQ